MFRETSWEKPRLIIIGHFSIYLRWLSLGTFIMGKGRYVHPIAQLEDDNDFAREAKVLEATGAFSLKELKIQRRLHKNRLAAQKSIAKRALNSARLQEENKFLQVSPSLKISPIFLQSFS